MTAAVPDTLRCAQTLKDAGFPTKQAEATAQVLGDALADVATKEDLDRQTAMQKDDLEAAVDRLETKIDAVNQRVHSMETSTQKQFASVQEQLGSFRDQFRHQARVTYILLAIIAGLAFGDLVAPYLPSGKTPTAPPATAESPTPVPDVHGRAS